MHQGKDFQRNHINLKFDLGTVVCVLFVFFVLNVSYSDDDLKVLNLNKNTDKNSQPLMNHLNNSNFDANDSSKEDVTDNLDNDIYIYFQ